MIKLNDTLNITIEQWFPKELDREHHLQDPYVLSDFVHQEYSFDKPLPRIYCLPPTRVFLVQNIDGKWIKWWHCLVTEQTIYDNGNKTKWKFKIIKIYDPEYMKLATKFDTPDWLNFFE